MRVSLVWFRNDLRLHDNITLCRAISESDYVIPVYIFDPRHYRKSTYGFDKIGPYRSKFVTECVADLRANLKNTGGDLLVRKGITEELLTELCLEHGVSRLYYSKEVAPDEATEERAVNAAMLGIDVEVRSFDNTMLLDRSTLPFSITAMPDIFTAFRWQVEKVETCVAPWAPPSTIKVPENIVPGDIPLATELCPQTTEIDFRAAIHFSGGESAGLAHLSRYVWELDGPATYFETRNQLIGEGYSTKLSAWLSTGALSARRIYREIKLYELERVANKSTYWIIFELLWRDFFRLNMEKYHCELFFQRGPRRRKTSPKNDIEAFTRWINGWTDDDFVNANMNELNRTGFMSNRGRQIVASYLVHDLNISWLMGASYFESMLIDYDVCSNYGNWAYIAGVGNDPRDNRYFNVAKQASMYDPDGAYRRLWTKNKEYET